MILAFDTETTGLVENLSMADDMLPEIIEFYGCLFDPDDGSIIREVETLIRPTRNIPDKITQITTISNDDVRDAPVFDLAADEIIEFIEAAPEVLAHNAAYDIEVVNLEVRRAGRPAIRWPKHLCSIEQTIHLEGRRLSLPDLHLHLFGKRFVGAHRARVDVGALVRCAVELRKRGDL